MNYKRLLLFFIVSGLFTACKNGDRQFIINGDVKGMPEQTIVLEQISANDIITIVDSQRSDKKGHFEISGIAPEPGLYRLHFADNRFMLLGLDKGMVKLTADWKTVEKFSVTGSGSSESLRLFLDKVDEYLRDINTLAIVLDTLQAKGKDSLYQVAKEDLQNVKVQFTDYVEHYADTTHFEPNAIFAVRMLVAGTEAPFLESFQQTLSRRFPGTRMTKEYAEYYGKISARIKQQKPTTGHVDVGQPAPAFTLSDPTGNPVTLEAQKGKFVLLSFWASFNKPSRVENESAAKAYANYKNNNFTIISISLDNNKDEWQKGIKDDKLTWINGSELRGLNSEIAKLYGVQSLPFNFLVDPAGKIIARDLRGDQLAAMLEKVAK